MSITLKPEIRTECGDEDEIVQANAEQRLDRQPGSGSLSMEEAWTSQSAQMYREPNDGRYDTRTTLLPHMDSEVDDERTAHQLHRDPEDRRSWSELAKWNDGLYEPDRPQQNFDADIIRWTETFCDFLDIPQYQTERTVYVVERVDFEALKQHRLASEKIILAVISLIVDTEMSVENPSEWDLDEWIIYDDRYEQLMTDLNMERSELWTARKLVHDQSDYFAESTDFSDD